RRGRRGGAGPRHVCSGLAAGRRRGAARPPESGAAAAGRGAGTRDALRASGRARGAPGGSGACAGARRRAADSRDPGGRAHPRRASRGGRPRRARRAGAVPGRRVRHRADRPLAAGALRPRRGARGEADAPRHPGGADHGRGASARSGPARAERRRSPPGQALPPRARARYRRGRAPPPPPRLTAAEGRAAMRLATIDVRTNMVRLLVAETVRGGWRAVERAQRVTRLGEGQADQGPLGAGPIARTREALAVFVRRAARRGAARVRIAATSAVRAATHPAAFWAEREAATGRAVEVLSGEDEARLTLLGVTRGLPH